MVEPVSYPAVGTRLKLRHQNPSIQLHEPHPSANSTSGIDKTELLRHFDN